MSLEPKRRIIVTPPKEGHNPYYISVSVADEAAREILNSLKDEPWAKGYGIQFIGDGLPIDKGKLHGRFIVNPCFDVGEIISLIESAVLNK